jgi:hypothetical protein
MQAELVVPPGIRERLGATLAEYQIVSRRTNEEVLVNQGKFLASFLYQSFKRDTPVRGSILKKIKSLGWALGRRDPAGQIAGISDTAYYRAQRRMGGFKSILAGVIEEDDKIVLRGVRIGKRGRRILGGRRGLGGLAVSGSDWINRKEGDVVLNQRAVQTIEEINLREAGRRFLAISFLYRRWLTQGRGEEKRTNLVNVQPRSSAPLLGEVNLNNGDRDQSLTLSSYVPGVAAIGESRGRFGQAMQTLVYSMREYLDRKQREALEAEIRKAVA